MADSYTVTTQTPTTTLAPGGTLVPAMRIAFMTKPSEVAGTVDVPMSGYEPGNVDRIIRAAVERIEAVQHL